MYNMQYFSGNRGDFSRSRIHGVIIVYDISSRESIVYQLQLLEINVICQMIKDKYQHKKVMHLRNNTIQQKMG